LSGPPAVAAGGRDGTYGGESRDEEQGS
jgi:hypothetical protein